MNHPKSSFNANPPMSNTSLRATACALILAIAPAFAALDIVESKSKWVVKDTSSGRVLGTFWSPNDGGSDFGYESSIVPDFLWSPDRDYLAVTGGASRSRAVSLYQVVGSTLKEIAVPQLDDQQAAPLNEITDSVADGTDAVRWQSDGTLLLHCWSAQRVNSDSEEQKQGDVWADLEVNGNQAKIVGTSAVEPSSSSSQSLPPNPAPPAGETLASPQYSQGDTGEQPPEESAPAFQFDKEDYYLRGDEAGIREYLTEGETFEKWSTLISTRRSDVTDDPRAYAFQLVKNAKASSPNAQGQVMENDEAGSYIADFLVFSEEGTEPSFAEWNLWRVEKTRDGIEAVQYARRFYDIDNSTAKKLIAARKKIVPQLAVLEIPQ
jgi:hypothetical protein